MDHLKVNRKKRKKEKFPDTTKKLISACSQKKRETYTYRNIQANKKCVNCSFSMWHANLKTRKALNNEPDPEKLSFSCSVQMSTVQKIIAV